MKLEDDPFVEDAAEKVISEFSSSLAQFAFKSEPSTPVKEPRRSPRKATRTSYADTNRLRQSPSKKRVLYFDNDDDDKVLVKPSGSPSKKQKRGFAPPEVYAHLKLLPDYLKPCLDIVFCGINPGQQSAKMGHHFGHPTNHFWPCLHQGGITPTRLHPTEDHTLPERFNIGLTNLVDRPTAEQKELAKAELKAGVSPFLAKIQSYQPRIVAFVGLDISKTVRDAVLPSQKSTPVKPGILPFKIQHSVSEGSSSSAPVSETLFFAMPSSSGLVVQYQLTAKIKIFRSLYECLEQVKSGSFDTGSFVTVDVPNVVEPEVTPGPSVSPLEPVDLSLVKAEEEPKAEVPICNPTETLDTES
ncbi:DNA glycosylase [Hymenopellis radicata]|nr:DNA glycosylase [Hymenopellis radicata]